MDNESNTTPTMADSDTQRRAVLVVLLRVAWVGLLLFLVVRALQVVRAWLLVSSLSLPPMPRRDTIAGSVRASNRSDAPTTSTSI